MELAEPLVPKATQPVEEESCIQKNDSAISLAIVTALIEIQTASKCERFTNLHICLGCYLNCFPFPVHMPIGSEGAAQVLPKLAVGEGAMLGGVRLRWAPGCRYSRK